MGSGATASRSDSDLDVGLLFFGREELPFAESALVPLFDRRPEISDAALAIVLEPTANRARARMPRQPERHGGRSRARRRTPPGRGWAGTRSTPRSPRSRRSPTCPIRDVEVDGLTYREVASVTAIEGGVATNVVPDRATAHVNFRYAPTHTPAEAERRLRELLGHPERDGRDRGQRPARPGARREPAGGAAPDRRRSRRRPEASVDARRGVRPRSAWTR